MKKGGAAKGELVLAIYELGNCFRNGWGVKKDPAAARQYFETAANLGDTDAMNEVAWCYLEGFGGKKDKVRLIAILRLLPTGMRFKNLITIPTLVIITSFLGHQYFTISCHSCAWFPWETSFVQLTNTVALISVYGCQILPIGRRERKQISRKFLVRLAQLLIVFPLYFIYIYFFHFLVYFWLLGVHNSSKIW
jgi:hypothetical protein